MAELKLLDPSGRQNLVNRVLRTYLVSLSGLLHRLQAALDDRDMAALRLAAHTLKSPSASVGAVALSDWCAQIERAALEDRLDEVPGLILQLQAESRQVELAVRRLLSD